MASLSGTIPPGVKVNIWYNQGVLVSNAVSSVRDAIAIGVGLAAIVLLIFLRNWRITAIGIFVVPMVLAATGLLLSVAGMGLNLMTLGGAAAAVGLIIDDTIVIVEHIVRRRRGGVGREWCANCRQRNDPAADGIVRFDDHHLRASGLPVRGYRRLLQGSVPYDGLCPRHLLSRRPDRRSARFGPLPEGSGHFDEKAKPLGGKSGGWLSLVSEVRFPPRMDRACRCTPLWPAQDTLLSPRLDPVFFHRWTRAVSCWTIARLPAHP